MTRIGIIGGGMIGGTLARLWVEAGHEVWVSSRHPEALVESLEPLGERAHAVTVEEAASAGEVLLLAVSFGALTSVAPIIREAARDTLVLDACNPFEGRDGADLVAEALALGSGVWTARELPEAHVVKAFNTVYYKVISDGGVGVPLAGEAGPHLERAASLVRDAGLEPVIVGGLAESRRFDPGTPVWNAGLDADALREALGVGQ